jgi:hypothetical protein
VIAPGRTIHLTAQPGDASWRDVDNTCPAATYPASYSAGNVPEMGTNNGPMTDSGVVLSVSGGSPRIAAAGGAVATMPSTSATMAALNLTDQALTGGANDTPYSGYATSGTVQLDCGKMRSQVITNDGALTLDAPTNAGQCFILIANGSTAGAVSLSGFSQGSSSVSGCSFNTTNGDYFGLFVFVNGSGTLKAGYSLYCFQ